MTDLLLEFLSHYGVREFEGPSSNPEITEMADDLGFDMQDDSTLSWCSLALNYYAKKCGYEYTNSLAARSWLKTSIVVLKPSLGDIVVLWRESPSSWKGHVGLFVAWDETKIWLLGGNTNNMISIAPYPRERVLGVRQLKRIDQ